MRLRRSVSTVIAALGASLGACGDATGPSAPTFFAVTEVEITGVTDAQLCCLTNLEVEVHLFDADSGEHLGCSGQGQGLRQVDASDLRYAVKGFFVDGEGRLTLDAVRDRRLYIEVVEDDFDPCPVPADYGEYDPTWQHYSGDDPIGISPDFFGYQLESAGGVELSFGAVVLLRLQTVD